MDYFVHGIGTGGCIAGVGKFLKGKNPACKVVALEPSEAPPPPISPLYLPHISPISPSVRGARTHNPNRNPYPYPYP